MKPTPRCRNIHTVTTLTVVLALVGAATLMLSGCGDAGPLTDPGPAPAAQSVPPAASAEPIDAGARTRQGLYLTSEQARSLARRLDDRLVTVEAHCCGPETAELDALMAFGMQAAANLPIDVPFVVSGRDLRQAAAVANRLAELGVKQVHLVTR